MESTDPTKVQSSPQHCLYCFDVISGILEGKYTMEKFPPLPEAIPRIETPLFVTWTKGADDDLRGCIGTFAKEAIADNLPKYAAISAFQDRRFSPIEKNEIPELSCSVSLLINFEKGKDAYDWEIGKNGITIELRDGTGFYRGTFLPEVAKEQGWTKEETLQYLLRKAGCSKSLKEVEDKIELERYQSSKHVMKYEEYKTLKGKTVV